MGSPIEAQGGFTPGEWTTEYDRSDIHILGSDFVGGSQTIATVYTRSNGPDCEAVAQANARLIAASPDLLDAAMIALGLIEGGRIYEQQCCDGKECGCRGSTYADEAEHFLRKAIAKATGGAA